MASVGPLHLTTVIYWCDTLRQALAGGRNYSSRILRQHLAVTLECSSKSSDAVSDARLGSVSYLS